MAENVIHEFPGVYDEDMNTDLYLLVEEEITEAQYNAIKETYGVTGPDFQIVKRGAKFFIKGDQDIDKIKETVNGLVVDKGGDVVFSD